MRPSRLFLASILFVLASGTAHADGFIVPFVGYNFGGDSSNCPSLGDCPERRINFGVSLGSMGAVIGFEEDLSYAKNFFGDTEGEETSVFSAMSNLMIGVGVGPVRPYVLGGIGLIRSRVSSLAESVSLDSGKTAFGYDLGGGVTALFGSNVGVRGDVRLLRTIQNVDLPVFDGEKLTFWRASAGLAIVF